MNEIRPITLSLIGPTRATRAIPSVSDAFALPCNQHDICYQTCGSNHLLCDLAMKNAMDSVCYIAYHSICPYAGTNISICPEYFISRAACFGASETYYSGLFYGGEPVWVERQTQYCNAAINFNL